MQTLTLLRDIAHGSMLDIACSRCERRGRLSIARLIRELGPDAPVHEAWAGLNADCPQREARGAGKACSLHAPGLAELLGRPQLT